MSEVSLKMFQQNFDPTDFRTSVFPFADQKSKGKEMHVVGGNESHPHTIMDQYSKVHGYKVADNTGFDKQNKFWKMQDVNYQITNDEITAIKREIQHVLKWSIESPRFMTVKNVGEGVLKYEYSSWNAVPPPRWSLDFSRGDSRVTDKASTSINLIGFDYDFHITKPQLDVYFNNDRKVSFSETLLQGNIRELTESLAIYREYALMRGSDIPNMSDHGVNGLLNNASVQDPGALGLGGDDDLTAAGDVYDAAIVMSNELILEKFKPPFTLMLSPGVMAQSLKNKEGTPKVSDFELINAYGRKEGMQIFNNIIINPFMIDTETETNSTGSMACLAPGSQNFEVIESYPMGYYPMPSFDLGLDGKLLWLGGTAVYKPNAVVYADALTTASFAA